MHLPLQSRLKAFCGSIEMSADNLCKQFGPRSGPTKRRARSGSRMIDTLVVFLKQYSEKLILKIKQQTTITQNAELKELLPHVSGDNNDI